MSADLFAIFGTPDEAPTREQLDERWSVPQGGPVSSATPHAQQSNFGNGDVLFDADETEAGDDFGDFANVENANDQAPEAESTQKHVVDDPRNVISVAQQVDLLDLGNDAPLEPVQEHRPFPSLEATKTMITTNEADDWGDFEDFSRDAQPEPRTVVQNAAPHISEQVLPLEPARNVSTSKDDGWDDFEEWNTDQKLAQDVTGDDTNTDSNTSRHLPEMPDELRPTNIPPPTILLQLLPYVFQSIQDQAKASNSPITIDETAASIVTVFAVSARIIAGRSLRWKRDTYLAQSTSIGPSTSGARSGGMKLTAINKTEAIREEREAADVCDAWSRNTHIFAGVVSRSEHRRPWMNLNIKMTPRPSPGFGTLEAREPCALCGIKRDERIAGVDFDADDVFSEYWTEHWGHTDCKVFWYTYRIMLDHR